jgi:hypothetical protein
VHVPAAFSVAVPPETVHTTGVVDAKLTAKPELAVAANASDAPAVCVEIAPNVIVCASPFTVKLCITGVAAR